MVRVVAALGLGLLLAACGADQADSSATLTVRGSDTMVILAQRWAEAFMAAHPELVVQVSGGGSGTGITALLNGTADIANASREMDDSERAQVLERRGVQAVEIPVAIDAIAIYVHRDNPVAGLSLAQLEGIYRGRINTWSELGVDGLGPIILYSRENNSGTYAYFKQQVLRDYDFAAEAQTLPGTAAVINAVSHDPGAIGYGGIGYAIGVRVVPIRLESGELVEPSGAPISGYPLSRPLLVYTAGQPHGAVAQFIEFIRSDEGQQAVVELGFFPLPPEAR